MLNNGGWSINLYTLLSDVLILRVGRYGDYLFKNGDLSICKTKTVSFT